MLKQTLIEHLEELRKRFINVFIFLIIFFLIGFLISPLIIQFIRTSFPGNYNLVVINPIEYIYTKVHVALYFSIALTIPIILYHLVGFTKPALNSEEKKIIKIAIPFIILFFIVGVLFSCLLLKIVLSFFSEIATKADIANLWSLNQFISFIFITSISLGVIFELPIIVLILKKLDIIDIGILKKRRRHAYILIFIFAAMTTPPDVLTQFVVAIPLILLYEFSILILRIFK